jgi:hypothetical protein
MKVKIVDRSNCRLCRSKDLTKILNFKSIPFFDEIVTKENLGKDFSYPMNLYFCNKCLSVQSKHDINIKEYYKNYQYVASNSPFIKNYMQSLVDFCFKRFNLRNDDKVIEVGAADGYLLSLFKDRGMKVLGFEGAENLCRLASQKGVDVINKLFEKNAIKIIPKNFKNVQLFVLLHTFDHLHDPIAFLKIVKKILDPKKGVFLIEVHDLNDIYTKHETSLFGHEHATFLHYNSISRLLKRQGFKIIEFNFLPKDLCRGSSMLVAATLEKSNLKASNDFSNFEQSNLDKIETFVNFQRSAAISFKNLRDYIESKKKLGKRFVGYGAWGRGVTTLAMAGITIDHLEFVADGNPNLKGCYTPATHIPILDPASITIKNVDEVIVFNYGYINEIKITLSDFLNQGGKIISVIDIFANKVK